MTSPLSDRADFENKLKKEYDLRMQKFLETQGKDGADDLRQQELQRIQYEEECRNKYSLRLKQEREHWKVMDIRTRIRSRI